MVSIRINGSESPLPASELPKFSDLIELIKSSIDPDHMITDIRLNGSELGADDWDRTPRSMAESILEIETNTPERFVHERLLDTPEVIQACFLQFRDARKTFQQGENQRGNRKLVSAVHTLRSFFEWYSTILQLMNSNKRNEFSIDSHLKGISDACNTLCQQQLYQSWWAVGETLEKKIEPLLDELETFCRKQVAQIN